MKKKQPKIGKGLFICLLIFIMSVLLCVVSLGAEDDFEKSIAEFPESYKPYLRTLHEKYPEWIFEPFKTGLDWNTVIDNEVGTKSLIDHNASSENLKSKEAGHYNQSTGQYIQKDSGFVVANRLAVEYFMDPRNFLTEDGIFQFELLSFDELFTVEDVEAVLKGTFMYDKKITYYTSDGTKKTSSDKYAEVIYSAGKTYNVNPCYLASKIRNEVGADGSASVSGTHSVYPGIYNFYNIGATDGSGAITRGLQWASSGSTYGRPWTTPQKSIKYGAQYIAESYISKGQFTGYLQKFNVNPNASNPLYYHQYMTNLTGGFSQGYTNYSAYAKTGKLNQKYVFSIPVYENVPSSDYDSEMASNADSAVQIGKISASYCNVRTGPSTNNAKLLDASGAALQLKSGHSIKILSKHFTDAKYYINILQYPHWVKISFEYNSKTYTGYVPEDFISYTTVTSVNKGVYNLSYLKGANTDLNIISSNSAIAKVLTSSSVEFLKAGTVYLTAYDSAGRYDIVKYTVSDTAVAEPSTFKATPYTETVKVTAGAVDEAVKYQYTVCDSMGNIVAAYETEKTSYSFKSLKNTEKFTVSLRLLLSSASGEKYSKAVSTSAVTKPYKVTDVSISETASGAKIKWTQVTSCEGYLIYGYDSVTGAYTKLSKISSSKSSADIPSSDLNYDSYCVRAYIKDGSKSIYGDYSDAVSFSIKVDAPSGITISTVTTEGYTLSWNAVSGAGEYEIHRLVGSKWQKTKTVSDNTHTFTGLEPGVETAYKVCAVKGSAVSEFSPVVYAMTAPETVTSLAVTEVGANSCVLTWDEAAGAAEYEIYILKDGKYTVYATSDTATCTVTDLSEITDYSFKVSAVAKSENNSLSGMFSKEVNVTTALASASSLVCVEALDTSVSLSWTGNPLASEYEVYLYDSANDKYTLKVTTDKCEAVVTSLKGNTQYNFAVKCVAQKDGETYVSDYSSLLKVKTVYPVPKNLTLSDVTASSYKLSWDKVDGATSYNIYRKDGDSFKKIYNTKNTYYTTSGLLNGDIAYYKVTAVIKDGTKSVEGGYSVQAGATTLPGKATGLKTTVYTQTVILKWNEVKNADYYNVYIYEDGEYNLQSKVTGTSYKIKGLSEGKTYKFTVRAYISLDTGTRKGSMASISATLKPATVSKINLSSVTNSSQKISWPAAAGANYYNVYRYSSKEKSYVLVGSTSSRSYTFEGISSGKTYSYKVESAVKKDGKILSTGAKSAVYKYSTEPAKVTSLKSTDKTKNTVSLSWKKVSGATYYQVSYCSPDTGKYVTAGTSTTNSFKMKGLSSKTTYKFKVRAIRTVSDNKYIGFYSSSLSVKTK